MSLAPDLQPLVQLSAWLRRGPATGRPEQRDAAERFMASMRLAAADVEDVPSAADAGVQHQAEANGTTAQREACTVLYLHGGGLVFYRAETFQPLFDHWRRRHGLRILPISYPRAPEATTRKILDHVVTQIAQCIAHSPENVRFVLAGDSIGGYLALQAWRQLRDERIRGLYLIYPVLDLLHERPSYAAYGAGFTLDGGAMAYFKSLWAAEFSRDCELNVLACPEFLHLPAVRVASAGCDVLRDEAFDWCEQLRQQGRQVRHTCFDDLSHDFCLFAGRSESCLNAINFIGEELAEMTST